MSPAKEPPPTHSLSLLGERGGQAAGWASSFMGDIVSQERKPLLPLTHLLSPLGESGGGEVASCFFHGWSAVACEKSSQIWKALEGEKSPWWVCRVPQVGHCPYRVAMGTEENTGGNEGRLANLCGFLSAQLGLLWWPAQCNQATIFMGRGCQEREKVEDSVHIKIGWLMGGKETRS